MESNWITHEVTQRLRENEIVIEYPSGMGIQSMNFLGSGAVHELVMLSNQTAVLESNVTEFVMQLKISHPSLHFLFSPEHGFLKDLGHEIRGLLSDRRVLVYIDLFAELTPPQLDQLDSLQSCSISGTPVEVLLQNLVESPFWSEKMDHLVIRCPSQIVPTLTKALCFFPIETAHYNRARIASSLAPPQHSSLVFVSLSYPPHSSDRQLVSIWNAAPPCHSIWNAAPPCQLKRHLQFLFSTVLKDRSFVLSSITSGLEQKGTIAL